MENQHRKITGYRDLSQEEIDLINEIKAKGEELERLHTKVLEHLLEQRKDATYENLLGARLQVAEPVRWAAIGKTHLQEGVMALTRAVAQPTSF